MFVRNFISLCFLRIIFGIQQNSNGHHALQIVEHLGFAKDTSGAEVRVVHDKTSQNSPIYYIKLPPSPYYYTHNNNIKTTPHPFQQLAVDFTSNGRPDQIYHWNMPPTTGHFWPTTTKPQDKPVDTFEQSTGNSEQLSQNLSTDDLTLPDNQSGTFEDNSILGPGLSGSNNLNPGGYIPHVPLLPIIPQMVIPPIPASVMINDVDNSYDESEEYNSVVLGDDIHTPTQGMSILNPTNRPTPNPSLSNDIFGIPSQFTNEKTKPWLQIGKEKGIYLYNGKPNNIYVWRPKSRSNLIKKKHPLFLHFNY